MCDTFRVVRQVSTFSNDFSEQTLYPATATNVRIASSFVERWAGGMREGGRGRIWLGHVWEGTCTRVTWSMCMVAMARPTELSALLLYFAW